MEIKNLGGPFTLHVSSFKNPEMTRQYRSGATGRILWTFLGEAFADRIIARFVTWSREQDLINGIYGSKEGRVYPSSDCHFALRNKLPMLSISHFERMPCIPCRAFWNRTRRSARIQLARFPHRLKGDSEPALLRAG
jgi:hypothetical protein